MKTTKINWKCNKMELRTFHLAHKLSFAKNFYFGKFNVLFLQS